MNININLHQSYEIEIINKNIDDSFTSLLNEKYLLVIDQNIYFYFKEYLNNIIDHACDFIIIEATEDNKSQASVDKINELLFKNHFSRSDYLIAIGGGIICDLTGYCASLYQRGLNLVYLPTTLLSQVDSSIGGKVAINYHHQKNFLGTFYHPNKVIIDTFFLTKLTTRIFKEGLVELIKHGLINDNKIIDILNNYDDIQQLKSDYQQLISLIKQSLTIKKDIVEQDPLDKSIRHLLNLGHTFAHALELETKDLYHGEAVALGLLVNAYQSTDYLKLKNLFEKFQLIRSFPQFDLSKMINDKKRSKNIIKEPTLLSIGHVEIKDYEYSELIKLYESNYEKIQTDYQLFKPTFIFRPTKLKGIVNIPCSKSMLHRYLIAASLSKQEVTLNNVDSLNDDIKATINVLKYLDTKVIFDSKQRTLTIFPFKYDNLDYEIYFNESATTLRMILPVLSKHLIENNIKFIFNAHSSLQKRPLTTYYKLFKKQSITYSNNILPCTFDNYLQPDTFYLEDNLSSQFISGLLFYLPLLKKDSQIILKDKPNSLPYIKMTIKTLKDFNIVIEHDENYQQYYIKANQEYQALTNYDIEQDYSSRSFFEVAKVFNPEIIMQPEASPSLQADYQLIDIINNDIHQLDLTDMPDSASIMSIFYSQTGGHIINTNRLIHKESNRLQAICDFLNQAKVNFIEKDNELIIDKSIFNGGYFNTYHDHRICMSLIIASTIANSNIEISEIKSINKSFPTFINEYERLGGFCDEQ